METMHKMTREIEERTAAIKDERDKLIAARQELEILTRRMPMGKVENSLSPDEDSESEAPCLLATSLESAGRCVVDF